MYKEIEENNSGQPLCPSHLRDGVLDLEKTAEPSSKKKLYLLIILLIIFLCGFILIASLFYGIAASQSMYDRPEKINGSTSNLYDKKKNPIVNTFDMKSKSLIGNFEEDLYDKKKNPMDNTFDIKKNEEKNVSFEGYVGYNILMDCHFGNQLNSQKIQWFHNREQIDTSNKNKYELLNGHLEIKNLTENDAGIYKCLLIYDANYKEVSYNLIIKDAYKWVDLQDLSEIEDPAYEKFYFNNVFNFGQLDTGESLVPGVLDEGFFLTIEMLGDELEKSDLLKVLMINKNVEYDWVEGSNGHVPSNALEAGYFNGEKFYIGSTLDSQQLGVVHPEAKVVLFPDDDYMKDDRFQVDYKVLVLKI